MKCRCRFNARAARSADIGRVTRRPNVQRNIDERPDDCGHVRANVDVEKQKARIARSWLIFSRCA
jgi:hypothetical protein